MVESYSDILSPQVSPQRHHNDCRLLLQGRSMAKQFLAFILLAVQSIICACSFVVSFPQLKSRRKSSSPALNMATAEHEKVFLIIGCCGLDRLLTVSRYPNADSKVRSTAYHEIGGGNAANTASAMALLSNASIFRNEHFRVKLVSKVGDDYIGQQLKEELQKCGVDTSLVIRGEAGSTTGFTSVIVSQEEQTRTCIHTPGTCGEFTLNDIASENLDDLFANVVHLHSDCRQADLSLMLANEARERNIPISVDAEKDRHVKSLDQLLVMADMLFTNSTQIEDYLNLWTAKLQAEHNRRPLAEPIISAIGKDNVRIKEICALGIGPSHFFHRWFANQPKNRRKEVIITK